MPDKTKANLGEYQKWPLQPSSNTLWMRLLKITNKVAAGDSNKIVSGAMAMWLVYNTIAVQAQQEEGADNNHDANDAGREDAPVDPDSDEYIINVLDDQILTNLPVKRLREILSARGECTEKKNNWIAGSGSRWTKNGDSARRSPKTQTSTWHNSASAFLPPTSRTCLKFSIRWHPETKASTSCHLHLTILTPPRQPQRGRFATTGRPRHRRVLRRPPPG